MTNMEKAMVEGMVLVLSIWDDGASNMLWLDSTYPVNSTDPGAVRGPCSTDSGDPKVIEPGSKASATYSNIRFGEIGTTDKSFPPHPPASPPPPPPPAPHWVKHDGYNCYSGQGGTPVSGSDAPFGNETPDTCGERCAATPGCTAFTVPSYTNPGNCWLRASIQLDECQGPNSGYDTYSLMHVAQPAARPQHACAQAYAPCNGTNPACCAEGYECMHTSQLSSQCQPTPALAKHTHTAYPGFHAPTAAKRFVA